MVVLCPINYPEDDIHKGVKCVPVLLPEVLLSIEAKPVDPLSQLSLIPVSSKSGRPYRYGYIRESPTPPLFRVRIRQSPPAWTG